MTSACRELEASISLRAAGALDAAEGARLDAHLAVCPACRAEAARAVELLDLVRLPPPTQAEHQVLADLPARVTAELRSPPPARAPASVRRGRRIALGVVVAAGIGAIALAPVVITRRGPSPAAQAPDTATATATASSVAAPASTAETVQASWTEPDLDTLWQDASVVAFESSEGG